MENGNALYQKFKTSSQPAVRLELALRGFFCEDGFTDVQRKAFGDYLKLRIRPAAEALIQRDDLNKLQVLESQGWMTAAVVEDCLNIAIRQKKTQAFLWLLELKTEKFGFRDRDFDL